MSSFQLIPCILLLTCSFDFQGNFHHWRPLFLHFDTYFKTYLACRNDLILSDKILEDDSPFPKHEVLQILRVMQIILENCPNKSSFDGLEVSCALTCNLYLTERANMNLLFICLFSF